MAKANKKETKKAPAKPAGPPYLPRLLARYRDQVVPQLREEFGITNAMAVPRIEKVVLNMGMGEATQNIKVLDEAVEELSQIAGQRPAVTRARKSIAAFKVREGMPIGCRVTLRGTRMWDFLDRLVAVALPRVRDFRGVPAGSFDGRGNYTLGIQDHLIFLDLDYNKVDKSKGLNVTVVMTTDDNRQAFALLKGLGMPFAQKQQRRAAAGA